MWLRSGFRTSGGVVMARGHLRMTTFAAVLREIVLELSPDHELAGQIERVEAR